MGHINNGLVMGMMILPVMIIIIMIISQTAMAPNDLKNLEDKIDAFAKGHHILVPIFVDPVVHVTVQNA
jgi:hypothetical protein